MFAAVLAIVALCATALVLLAALSPRFAEQVFRLPAPVRNGAVRHRALSRVSAAFGWVALEVVGFTAECAQTGKPSSGVVLGLIVGAVTAGAGDIVLARLLETWGRDHTGRTLPLPSLVTNRCAADMPRPQFVPRFVSALAFAAEIEGSPRFDRLLRWARNGLAVVALASIVLARVSQASRVGRGGEDGPPLAIYVFMFTLGLVGLVVLFQHARRKHADRRAAHRHGARLNVQSIAHAHGWHVCAPTAKSFKARWPGLPFFPVDADHRALQALAGHVGAYQLFICEERSGAKSSREFLTRQMRHTVYVMWLPGVDLPSLSLAGRDARYPVEQIGNQTLESETFNRRFHVSSVGAKYASAVLTPRLMHYLLGNFPEGSQLVLGGDAVALVAPGRLQPWRVEQHVACLSDTVALLPSYLLRDHRIESLRQQSRPIVTY
ncbi:MAG: hypothetical protein QOG53_1507 [Frankiales bacterium]|jgi:hypothetical protein|nr:hypothetical protein [Frankiales bacterium]